MGLGDWSWNWVIGRRAVGSNCKELKFCLNLVRGARAFYRAASENKFAWRLHRKRENGLNKRPGHR